MRGAIPAALAPLVLSGCAFHPPGPPTVTAQAWVTTLIAEQVPKIRHAQAELAQASAVRLAPAPSLSPRHPLQHGLLMPPRPALTSPAARATTPAPARPPLRYTGSSPGVPALTGRGEAATLRQAVSRILPIGWQQRYAPDLKPDRPRPLRWDGNDQWPQVLNKTLHPRGLVAQIDWADRRVSVSPLPLTPATHPLLPAALPPAPPAVWQIAAGSTLKDALFSWAAAAHCNAPGVTGWTVAWVTPVNYRVDAPLRFTGTFRTALNGLFTLYGTASVPLYAGLREEQCVVNVDDREPR